MNNNNETTILQEGNVKITDHRLLIGTETYGISNIKSVNLTRQTRSKKPLLLILLGMLLAYWSAITDGQFIEFFNIGIALVISGIFSFLLVKRPYTIHLETSWGKIGILNTIEFPLTKRIVDAMNTAIARNKKQN